MKDINILLTLWRIGAVFRRTQLDTMLEFLDLNSASRVLDAGCGHGLADLEILKLKPTLNLILLDISLRDLHVAKMILPTYINVDFVQASATHIPLRNGAFDRVLISSVLQHIPNCFGALKEVARILRSNGVLVLNVPSEKPYVFLPKLFGKKIIKLFLSTFGMLHLFDLKRLIVTLRSLGFRITKYAYVPSFLSMFLFELIAFFMMMEKIYSIKLSKIIITLSMLFPLTRSVEKMFKLSIGTEYVAKFVKVK